MSDKHRRELLSHPIQCDRFVRQRERFLLQQKMYGDVTVNQKVRFEPSGVCLVLPTTFHRHMAR